MASIDLLQLKAESCFAEPHPILLLARFELLDHMLFRSNPASDRFVITCTSHMHPN